MRQHIYKAKRIDRNEWVTGSYLHLNVGKDYICDGTVFIGTLRYSLQEIEPTTLCEYTGCREFTISNGYGENLFENDIVEVWKERAVYGRRQSEYDKWVKVRGVLKFNGGSFYIDFNNEYNISIFKARGKEAYDRNFIKTKHLVEFYWPSPENLKWQQEHNPHYKYDDIVRIGNIFDDNSEYLLKLNGERL